MEEITQEIVKKFWEWCGFTPFYCCGNHCRITGWWIPDAIVPADNYKKWAIEGYRKESNQIVKDAPPLDLNNLFKYAFDRLLLKIVEQNPDFTKARAIHYLFQAWEIELRKEPNYTKALFNVAQEVIHAK
jgi:hypothetical protein